MKKAVFLLLAFAVCLGLCACSGKEAAQSDSGGSSDYTVGTNVKDHALVGTLCGNWYMDELDCPEGAPMVVSFAEDGTCTAQYAAEPDWVRNQYVWWIDLDQSLTEDYLYICTSDNKQTVFVFTVKLQEDGSLFSNLHQVEKNSLTGRMTRFVRVDG